MGWGLEEAYDTRHDDPLLGFLSKPVDPHYFKRTPPLGRAIKSAGRTMVCTSQGDVTTRVRVSMSQHAARDSEPDPQVPLGSPDAHTVSTGDLMFAKARDPTAGMRPGNNGVADAMAFACLNGLARHEDLVYMGQARNMATHDAKGEAGGIITVQVAGSLTAINNGPDEVMPGELVCWHRTPWYIKMHEPGSKRPGLPCVQVLGQPLDKIVPILGVYNETDMIAEMSNLRGSIESHLMKLMRPLDTLGSSGDDAKTYVREVERVIKQMMARLSNHWAKRRYPDLSMPIQMYTKWVVVQCVLAGVMNHHILMARLSHEKVVQAALVLVAASDDTARDNAMTSLKEATDAATSSQRVNYVAEKVRDMIQKVAREEQDGHFTQKMPETAMHDMPLKEDALDCLSGFRFSRATTPAEEAKCGALREQFYTKAASFVAGRAESMAMEHGRWARRSIIGKSLMGGQPGKQIDLLTGVFLVG
jgi:hypothetical protein